MVAENVLANFLSCNDVKKFYKFEEISESTITVVWWMEMPRLNQNNSKTL